MQRRRFRTLDPRYLLARCVRCGLRGAPLCPHCGEQPWAQTTTPRGVPVHAIGHYDGYLGECVRRLKYEDETHLAFPLGCVLEELLVRVHGTGHASADVLLLPVPLHPARLAERGYNQSALVAAVAARRSGVELITSCLFRTEMRAAQARLSATERRQNLAGAFRADVPSSFGRAQRILLVDDVMTTGSTVDSCALALEAACLRVSGVLACAIAGTSDV